MLDKLINDLERDEGLRLKPYKDTMGKTTIGIGRNIDDVGITREEAYGMLSHDLTWVFDELDNRIPWWRYLPDDAQRGLANMAFNLGVPRLMAFKKMLAALESEQWEDAAKEALDSTWAKQVGARAVRISKLFKGSS